MFASKEEARKANKALWDAATMLDGIKSQDPEVVEAIKRKLAQAEAFIDLAEAKLPTDAAFVRDQSRRKQTAAK